MKSILQELYSGNLYPDEQIVPQNPEYRKLCSKLSDEMDAWKENLSPEQYDRLKNFHDLHMDTCSILCFQNFAYGFKLGMLLTSEVYTSEEDI